MFASLKIRDFRIFWIAMFFSLIGTWIQSMAQSWLVFELTHSAFLMGLVGFLSYLPISLFSLAAGVFVDRIIKKNLLIATQLAFMISAFILAFLVQNHAVRVWHIVTIAFLNGIVLSFDAPARQSMVVELVGKNHLLNAVALNSASFSTARILGPALAGILIASIGMGGCFYVNAFSFLPVVVVLALIKPRAVGRPVGKNTFFQDMREILSYIKNNPFLLALLALVGMISIFGLSYIILMPIFAQEILHSGSPGLAFLLSANGVGALLGALNLARLKDANSKLNVLKGSAVIFFISVMLFSLSKSLRLSSFLLVFAGFGGASSLSVINTLLQLSIPDGHRGRLMAVFTMVFIGFMPFGNLISGTLAHIFGAQAVVFLGGLISFIFCIAIVRKYLSSIPQTVAST